MRTPGPARPPFAILTSFTVAALSLLAPVAVLAGEAAAPAVWSYEGDTGPEAWGSLAPEYAACELGEEQSPVDIPVDAPVLVDELAYAYVPSPATIVDNGHAIQVSLEEAGAIVDDGRTYALRQFHFHTPSEHSLEGRELAMELHLVHQDAAGDLGVVAVLIVEGDENAALAPIWAALPVGQDAPLALPEPVDASTLLPASLASVAYPGSLTTPPCTEGVAWHVLVEPIELSAEQIAVYRTIHPDTDRPTQAFGDRMFEGP